MYRKTALIKKERFILYNIKKQEHHQFTTMHIETVIKKSAS